jgi:hypothetical protein
MIDPDRPRFKAPALLKACAISRSAFANRKLKLALYQGHGVKNAPKYSLTDIAEAVSIEALVALGHKLESAALFAESWRKPLSNTLRARLNFGVWSRVGAVLEDRGMSVKVSFDTIAEQVITALHLPLPVLRTPPAPRYQWPIAEMVSAYVDSDDFRQRCDKFRAEVLARRRPMDWAEASVRLAVPLWIIIKGMPKGAKGIVEEAEAAEGETPISIAHVLQQQLGVDIVEAAPRS